MAIYVKEKKHTVTYTSTLTEGVTYITTRITFNVRSEINTATKSVKVTLTVDSIQNSGRVGDNPGVGFWNSIGFAWSVSGMRTESGTYRQPMLMSDDGERILEYTTHTRYHAGTKFDNEINEPWPAWPYHEEDSSIPSKVLIPKLYEFAPDVKGNLIILTSRQWRPNNTYSVVNFGLKKGQSSTRTFTFDYLYRNGVIGNGINIRNIYRAEDSKGTLHRWDRLTGYSINQYRSLSDYDLKVTDLTELFNYVPFASRKQNDWYSCNRKKGSVQTYEKGAWRDIHNVFVNDLSVQQAFNYKSGWQTAPLIGKDSDVI